jgi:hypothetical protein
MAKLTRKEAEYIIATGAAIDFLTEGKFTAAVARRVKALARRAGPTVARGLGSTAVRLGGTALGTARFIAMRHPYITGAAVIYTAVKNREELADLAREGWEVVQDVGAQAGSAFQEALDVRREQAEMRPSIIPGVPAIIGRSDPIDVLGLKKPKRRKSSYNKAVSSAMRAVKKSKFLGKPGKFTSPKKAFATVNRTVSRIKKGAKVGTKGVTGVIKRAVRKIL